MGKVMQRSYMNAGGLFFFNEKEVSTFEEDVLASHLYFQLAASVKHDKFVEGGAWRQTYLRAMSSFAYDVVRRDVQSIPVDGQGSVWERVRHELGKWVSSSLVDQAQHSFSSLRENEVAALGQLQAYTTQSLSCNDRDETPAELNKQVAGNDPSSLSRMSLQLAFVDKAPVLTQMFLSCQTTCPVSTLPFPDLLSQQNVVGNLELMIVISELEDHRYARFRGEVLKKLGARPAELIIEVGNAQPGVSTCLTP
jgi:hypothetical protein